MLRADDGKRRCLGSRISVNTHDGYGSRSRCGIILVAYSIIRSGHKRITVKSNRYGNFPIPRAFETDGEKLSRLELENKQLIEELAVERVMRRDAEERAERLQQQVHELENAPHRKRRTKAEMEAAEPKVFSEFKSDGKRKPRPADPVRSYEDFAAVQNYFLEQGKIRDWALWTIGVSLGLRISDLLSLKICYLLNDDKTFRKTLSKSKSLFAYNQHRHALENPQILHPYRLVQFYTSLE